MLDDQGTGEALFPARAGAATAPPGTGYAATFSCRSRSAGSGARPGRLIWSSRWPRHSARLRMRGALPSGWRLTRMAFTGFQQMRRHTLQQRCDALVGGHHRVTAVEHQRGMRLVRGGHSFQCPAHLAEGGVVQRGRPAGSWRRQGRTPRTAAVWCVPHRNIQRGGRLEHHLAAGRGASGLDEADVPRGGAGAQRQFELAEPPRARASRAAALLRWAPRRALRHSGHGPVGNRTRVARWGPGPDDEQLMRPTRGRETPWRPSR